MFFGNSMGSTPSVIATSVRMMLEPAPKAAPRSRFSGRGVFFQGCGVSHIRRPVSWRRGVAYGLPGCRVPGGTSGVHCSGGREQGVPQRLVRHCAAHPVPSALGVC